jgi:hypothetical protein
MASYVFANEQRTIARRREDGVLFPWNPVTGRPVSDLGHVYQQWWDDGQPQPAPYTPPPAPEKPAPLVDDYDRARRRAAAGETPRRLR